VTFVVRSALGAGSPLVGVNRKQIQSAVSISTALGSNIKFGHPSDKIDAKAK